MTPLGRVSVRNQKPMHMAPRQPQPVPDRSSNFSRRFVLHLLLLIALLLLPCRASRADEVFDCSEGAFLAALDSGEALFIEDCSITITAPITISESNSVVVDAQGHNVSL